MYYKYGKLISALLVLCMVISPFTVLNVFASDATVSQPMVSGVYFDGAPILGETVTIHYTVNNPDNSLDDLDTKIKWFKQDKKYFVRNEANTGHDDTNSSNVLQTGGLSFTIPDDQDLVGKYISVRIPVASIKGNSRMRTMGIGPIAASKTQDMVKSSVTIISGSDVGVGGDTGDKLVGKFITPDGEYRCQWYSCDTSSGTYEAIAGETNNYYIPDDKMRGKYIKFGVVPITDGVDGQVMFSDNFVMVGNAAFGAFVSGNKVAKGWYDGCAMNSLTNGISGTGGGAIFTYADAPATLGDNVVVDLGKMVPVEKVIVLANAVDNDYFTLEYSLTGEAGSWQPMIPATIASGTENGIKFKNDSNTEAVLSQTYIARYIRVYFTHTKNMYFREIEVMSKEDKFPVITLEGETELNLLKGQPYEEAGYSAIDNEDGDLTSSVIVSGDVNVNEIGEYIITYTVTDNAFRPHTVSVTRTVNVADGFHKDGDLAYEKDVTVTSGTGGAAVTDGNMYTLWEPQAQQASAVVDLGEEQLISKFEVSETGNNIESFKIYTSVDGEEYDEIIASDDGMGNYVVDITPVKARYIKISINSENTASAINDFCCYFDDLGKVKYAADKLEIDADLDNVTDDLPLPEKGEFDAEIEWSSDDTSTVSDNGAVTRGGTDTDVTLTASVTIGEDTVTKDFEITVLKKKTSSGGGGGGGSYVTAPYTPVAPVQPIVVPDKTTQKIFSDVSKAHWAYEHIDFLATLDLVSGFPDGSFGPDITLTRSQFLKMVLDALALKAEGECDFADVNESDWYFEYVKTGVALGIVNGMEGGIFGADLPVTRQDMAVISAKALQHIKLLPDFETVTTFADNSDISSYAIESVGRMKKAGIMVGDTNGNFRPFDGATRAEASKIVTLLYKLKGGI